MGYSIPPYTMPPMTLNVAAEVGKSFGNALREYGRIKRQERKDAKKLLETQNAFKNEILLNQEELKTGFFNNVKAAGIYDTEKENELYDQFSSIIDTKAKAALNARMAMQFDTDLSDEDRAAYAKTITDFKSYSQTSLTQMGDLLADIDSINNMDSVIVGSPTDGTQLINRISLENLSGKPAAIFGEGTIMSRELDREAADQGKNIINSTVKIPVNSPYFANVNSRTGGGASQMIQGGLNAGNIKTETIDGKEYYVFKNDINLSNYSLKGGMDLVQSKIQVQKANDVLQENKFLDDKGAWNTNFISAEPVITQEIEKDSTGENTGYQKKVEFQIIDVAKMQADPAFQLEMASEYGKIFENGGVTNTQRQAYLLDIGSMVSPSMLNKTNSAEAKASIIRTMTENLWSGYFAEQYESTGDTPQNIQMQLGKEGQTLEQMKKEDPNSQAYLILKNSRDLGIKNPLTQKLYKPGETIYLKRTEDTRTFKEEKENPQKIDQMADLLMKSDEDIIKTLTNAPFGVTNRGSFIYKGGEIRLVQGDDSTKYPMVSMKEFRDMLRNASSTARN